jgi:hypothetical protein
MAVQDQAIALTSELQVRTSELHGKVKRAHQEVTSSCEDQQEALKKVCTAEKTKFERRIAAM